MLLMPHTSPTVRAHASPKRLSMIAVSLSIVFVLASLDLSALAQERGTLVRMLGEARDFRVRARAALALGSTGDASAVPALSTALHDDDSPAVRAAAASALGTLGSSDALPALRAASRDGSSDVRAAASAAIRTLSSGTARAPSTGSSPPSAGSSARRRRMPMVEVLPPARDIDWAHTSYAVVMGSMENRSSFTHTGLATMLQHEVHRGLIVLRGVAILDGGGGHPEAAREITRRRIPSFRMEGSIATIHRERRDGQVRVRCDVTILVMDEPGRNLRASLNANSTAMEDAASSASDRTDQERDLAEQALEAAAERAMGGAARALSSSR